MWGHRQCPGAPGRQPSHLTAQALVSLAVIAHSTLAIIALDQLFDRLVGLEISQHSEGACSWGE